MIYVSSWSWCWPKLFNEGKRPSLCNTIPTTTALLLSSNRTDKVVTLLHTAISWSHDVRFRRTCMRNIGSYTLTHARAYELHRTVLAERDSCERAFVLRVHNCGSASTGLRQAWTHPSVHTYSGQSLTRQVELWDFGHINCLYDPMLTCQTHQPQLFSLTVFLCFCKKKSVSSGTL